MAGGNDIFADLLGGGSSKKPSNESSLSMSQRMGLSGSSYSSLNASRTSGMNIDILDSKVGSQPKVAKKSTTTGNTEIDDLLSSFEPAAASGKSAVQQKQADQPASSQTTSQTTNQTTDLLEDFFGAPVAKPAATNQPKLTQSTAYESLSSGPVASEPTIDAASAPTDSQDLRDDALAQLVDMGFSIDQAGTALDATENGHDVNEAINLLMTAAHRKTSSRQSYNHSPPAEQHEEDFGSIVNDLSSEFMSKASMLFNSGRKKVQEGLEMYKQHQFDKGGHQPAWMRNQQQYKAKSIPLPDQDDDEEGEMDFEQMRRLTERQRMHDMRLQRKKREGSNEPMQPDRSSTLPRRRFDDEFDDLSATDWPTRPATAAPAVVSKPTAAAAAARVPVPVPVPVAPSEPAPEPLLDIFGAPAPRRRGKANNSAGISVTQLTLTPLTYTQDAGFTEGRSGGGEAFKQGDFAKALEKYQTALEALPTDHPLKIIVLSNVANVYGKLGNAKNQLQAATQGLDAIKAIDASVSQLKLLSIESEKKLFDFWVKLQSRKAEALEHLEKFKEAFESYNLLMDQGINTRPVLDGRRRCLAVLNPSKANAPAAEARPQTSSASGIPRKSAAAERAASAKADAALKRIQKQDAKDEQIENEKFKLHDQVERKLDSWRHGNEDNIRALLSSLQNVLWPDLNWKPVSMSDLVLDKKVKVAYMKAVAKVHPDKVGSNVSVENQMIANGVFITLNEAWEKYKGN